LLRFLAVKAPQKIKKKIPQLFNLREMINLTPKLMEKQEKSGEKQKFL
jgi:hypothetical protein